ncbi:MAG: Holliday junction resolvase RuvX [Oscillospiraceae bacterium]|nr:Holliday junction resolvase RuvX [Oscillospiraceae bacterium]
MRIMAIDYGDARTGIAVSDPNGVLSGDAWTINAWNAEKLCEEICGIVQNREIGRIVLGYPKNMNGTLGPRAEKSAALAELLREKTGLEVILWDERLTTVDAHRILSDAGKRGKKRKEKVDAVAASLILDSYLDSLK